MKIQCSLQEIQKKWAKNGGYDLSQLESPFAISQSSLICESLSYIKKVADLSSEISFNTSSKLAYPEIIVSLDSNMISLLKVFVEISSNATEAFIEVHKKQSRINYLEARLNYTEKMHKNQISGFEKTLKYEEKAKDACLDKLRTLWGKVEDLKTDNEALKQENYSLALKVKVLDEEWSVLKNIVSSKDQQLLSLNNQLQTLSSIKSDLVKIVEELSEENHRLTAAVADFSQLMDDLLSDSRNHMEVCLKKLGDAERPLVDIFDQTGELGDSEDLLRQTICIVRSIGDSLKEAITSMVYKPI